MKLFICLIGLCLVAVQAFPDELIKLDPETVVKAIEEAVPTEAVGTTEATVEETTPKKAKSQGTTDDRTRLVTNLFKNYNKRVNPDNVKVEFSLTLLDFHVLEDMDAVESHIWTRQDWIDSRLTWAPEEYGGTELIRMEAGEIWKPDITLYNSVDPIHMMNCWQSNVLIYSNGHVLWVPPCKMLSSCHLNLKKEPYGKNTCTWKFGSWTFDGNVMDIQFKKNASMDTSHLTNTSGFEIVENVAERHEKFYPCCKEPYPDLTFNLTLTRIPGEELFKRF